MIHPRPLHPPIRTDRLTLRRWTQGDHAALLDLTSRPDVVRYLLFPARDARSASKALGERIARGVPSFDADGQTLSLAVERSTDGVLVGDVVLMFRSVEHRDAEIGYIFHPDHAGHGFATEACRRLLAIAFDHYRLHRVFARLDARNDASARLLRRLDMRQEAHFIANEWVKGEWTDELVFAILDHEYAATNAQGS